MAGAGGVGADQNVAAVAVHVGDLRQRHVQHRDVVGGGVRARVPRPEHASQRFAGGVEEAQQRVIAERLLPRLGRRTASPSGTPRSWRPNRAPARRPRTRPPSRTASRSVSPACAQASSRACARATRSRASAASSSASSTRHAVGSDATGPNRSGWLRSTAKSEMASPPSASITARSSATRPGSCPDPAAATTPTHPTSPPSGQSRPPRRPAAAHPHAPPRHTSQLECRAGLVCAGWSTYVVCQRRGGAAAVGVSTLDGTWTPLPFGCTSVGFCR